MFSWYVDLRASWATSACLKIISQLQKLFLEIYIKRDYPQKHYFYERKIHYHFIKTLRKLRVLRRFAKPERVENMLRLFDAVIAVGQLRYRVKDYSTFEMIEPELQALSVSIQTEKVIAVENNYYNTLSVAAADPLVFLLFIDALKQIILNATRVRV